MPMFSAVKYIAKTEFLNPPGIQYQHTVQNYRRKVVNQIKKNTTKNPDFFGCSKHKIGKKYAQKYHKRKLRIFLYFSVLAAINYQCNMKSMGIGTNYSTL